MPDAAFGRLLDRSHLLMASGLLDLSTEYAADFGGRDVGLFLVDHEQRALHAMPGSAGDSGPHDVDATLAGRAYRLLTPVDGDDDGGRRIWVPLIDGIERLGVLGVTVDKVDEEAVLRTRWLAAMLAELVISRQAYSDLCESVRRTRPMTLAAELQRSLLPPFTVGTEQIVLSAVLEPCYDIGGDSFDYSIGDDMAQVLLLDAMGHGLDASVIAAVAVAAYRGQRVARDLVATYHAMDESVSSQFGPSRFATGVLCQLDVHSGRFQWISAGHPPGLLLREGRVVKTLEQQPTLPFGLSTLSPARPGIGIESLQPGDRVLLMTDGVLEARTADGEFFGVDRLVDFLQREEAGQQPVPETLRRLSHAILAHHDGQLADDATVVMLEWHGDQPAVIAKLLTAGTD
jgi:serine phosphatase RsbU (regulator of sigma subunit)